MSDFIFLGSKITADGAAAMKLKDAYSLEGKLRQPTRLPHPWDSPGKNTGVGCHFLLQGNLLDAGIELGSPALQTDSLPTELSGKSQFILVNIL